MRNKMKKKNGERKFLITCHGFNISMKKYCLMHYIPVHQYVLQTLVKKSFDAKIKSFTQYRKSFYFCVKTFF